MRIFAFLIAILFITFAVIGPVSALESKEKSTRHETGHQKVKRAASNEATQNQRNIPVSVRFQSMDANNIYFQLNPTRAIFTIEF